MNTITENNKPKVSKLFLRCAKDNGKYIQLKQYLRKHTILTYNPTDDDKQMQKLKYEIMSTYPYFAGQGEYINDLSIYIANNIIGLNESYQLFKNFIIDKKGKKCLEHYETYTTKSTLPQEEIYRHKNILQIKEEKIDELKRENKLILCLGPLAYLYYGFSWRDTEEGFNFWSLLNKQWIDYLVTYVVNYNMKL